MSFDDLARNREQSTAAHQQRARIKRDAALQHNRLVEKVLKEFATAVWGKNGGFLSTPKWTYEPLDIDSSPTWSIRNSAYMDLVKSLFDKYGPVGGAHAMNQIALTRDQSIVATVLLKQGNQPVFSVFAGSAQAMGNLILIYCDDTSEESLRGALRKLYQGFDTYWVALNQLPEGHVHVEDHVVLKHNGPYLHVETLLFG